MKSLVQCVVFAILLVVSVAGAPTCHRLEFQCANGQCIDYQSECDQVVHCDDGSDERQDCFDPCMEDENGRKNGGCPVETTVCRSTKTWLRYKFLKCECKEGTTTVNKKENKRRNKQGNKTECVAPAPTPSCYSNFYNEFNDIETEGENRQVYFVKQKKGEDVEAIAKRLFLAHLRVAPVIRGDVMSHNPEDAELKDYFNEWRKWSNQDQDEDVNHLEDFQAISSLKSFTDCFYSPDTKQVDIYTSGNDGIVGYVALSRRTDTTILAVVNVYMW